MALPSYEGFAKEIWIDALLREYRGVSLSQILANAQPTKVEGKTAHFVGLRDLTVNDYEGSVTFEDAPTEGLELTMDKAKYIAFKVDDVAEAQGSAPIMSGFMNKAAYQLAKQMDADLIAVIKAGADNANKITKTLSTPADGYDAIVDLGVKLDQQDVPVAGRVVVINPAEKALIAKDIRVVNNTAVLPNGVVQGMVIAGMQVIQSNRVAAGTMIALDPQAVCHADLIERMEAVRIENAFADGVKSLVAYGNKVLNGKGIAVLAGE